MLPQYPYWLQQLPNSEPRQVIVVPHDPSVLTDWVPVEVVVVGLEEVVDAVVGFTVDVEDVPTDDFEDELELPHVPPTG